MRVMVVGSGGREHALALALSRAPSVRALLAAPGNPGIAALAECLPLRADDVGGVVEAARAKQIDLVVVGPEAPLVAGLADALRAAGIACFGPSRAAAALEGSKTFAKELMARLGIPTARFASFEDLAEAERYIERLASPPVVKADGLAAGKGVVVASTTGEAIAAARGALRERRFGTAGARIVVEERLQGEEASVIALCDGTRVVPLTASQDHKRLLDRDEGPNTGGMGAYSPVPALPDDALGEISARVLEPIVRGLAADGTPFVGALYAGLMLTADGPRVLEYNARFGDPETQAILARADFDVGEALYAAATGRLGGIAPLRWRPEAAACVVVAAEGYPAEPRTGDVIDGLDEAGSLDGVMVFHAGTKRRADGAVVSSGGRVLGVTALGATVAAAAARAQEACDRLRLRGAHWRRDIGARAIARERP